MKFRIALSVFYLSLFGLGFSQQTEPCGIDQVMGTERGERFYRNLESACHAHALEQSSLGSRANLTVPLVFHIVYNTPQQNIPDSLIFQQIERLNEDFQRLNADTVNTPAAFAAIAGAMDVEFCLATEDPMGNPTNGIVRVASNQVSFASVSSYSVPDPVKHTSSGGSDAWNTKDYLNIWICNLTGSTAYTAPVGNFVDPADDGIVCHYNHIGNTGVYPYGEGRSIVHEMGHWFGLKHIWGDDNGTCNGTDFIGDTPNQSNWNGNCPSFPVVDNCSPNPPGVMFMNYMDYTDDGCRNMFSEGQTSYMALVYDVIMSDYYLQDKCSAITDLEDETVESPKIDWQSEVLQISWNQPIRKVDMIDPFGRLVEVWNPDGGFEFRTPFAYRGVYFLRIWGEGKEEVFIRKLYASGN